MAEVHLVVGCALIVLNLAAFAVGGIAWFRDRPSVPFWYLLRAAQVAVFLQALLGGLLVFTGHEPADDLHYLYGILPLVVSFLAEGARAGAAERELGDIDFEALPAERPAGPGPGDRPPRDGDHGRQLRRDPLPRPPRRRHQRRLLARQSMRKTGWSGAMRRSSSSGESAPTAVEEGADLPFPLLQVGAQKRRLLVVERARLAANSSVRRPSDQAPVAADPQVAHPLRVAARCRPGSGCPRRSSRLTGRAPPLAALAPFDFQYARAGDADAEPGQRGDDPVEDVLGEPAGLLEASLHRFQCCSG